MKIVILDAETLTINNDIDFSIFDQYGDVTIYPFTKDEEIPERIKDVDIILCNKSPMNRENLCHAKDLKYIGLFATGYNNVDLEYTKEKNITVCNAGSYSADAVTQHVFALILHYYNTIFRYDNFVKEEGWIHTNKFSPFMEMKELYGKTIGIIGYGSIGRKVAQVANAFGMNVLAYSRSALKQTDRTTKELKESIQFVDIDTLLENSDIVTVHCPLNKDSEEMCDMAFFKKMKKDSLFINTSRGGVVNEGDLLEALNNNIIRWAALDVIDKEPMTSDCQLLKAKNIIITPHAAWAPVETRTRLIKIVSENLKKWLAGTPINVIE
ncbi:MAG: NAD(P)-binding domain-containing protein [Eubacterium sp.]|jgi:glycerate dehydrogenase|nr:NAD(P)-binding domain-containing protein [Eubacterium sp.]